MSLVKRVAEKKKLPCEALDGKQVFLLAGDGDKEALECLDEYTRELAVQIFNLQNILIRSGSPSAAGSADSLF